MTTKTRKNSAPEAFWIEIRAMYETGNYTQRDLEAYAKSRGYSISQSRISSRAVRENWVKGAIREEIEKAVTEKVRDKIGAAIVDMLEMHVKQSQAIQMEAMVHFQKAQEERKKDKTYTMAPNTLATLTASIDRSQVMNARALGWDYKEGKPFRPEDDEDEQKRVPDLRVRRMSEVEEEKLRGATEDDDVGMPPGFDDDDEDD